MKTIAVVVVSLMLARIVWYQFIYPITLLYRGYGVEIPEWIAKSLPLGLQVPVFFATGPLLLLAIVLAAAWLLRR
jgi:hypothetical protein